MFSWRGRELPTDEVGGRDLGEFGEKGMVVSVEGVVEVRI